MSGRPFLRVFQTSGYPGIERKKNPAITPDKTSLLPKAEVKPNWYREGNRHYRVYTHRRRNIRRKRERQRERETERERERERREREREEKIKKRKETTPGTIWKYIRSGIVCICVCVRDQS
ncbi:hypothetical protein SODALDRAFT_101924 [Sodiomyces alkalinus F11]|uniref:Uncharacterized protein n=1 Tax=Sodiomyces alkalinus (strain CBS 110278 / VKM F-3762 / F11) TaxID=1314773 RepID=A0A3N2Q1U4_SODAK|nr:hypothetical protein SODALDRAFT_101924 [Sodiomyces alkalinus F11]ROT40658.1 hypothetical protein SODALDRAFT_101924 [Sodiomyces alkalinus F11]